MTDTLAAPPPKTKSQALRSYDVADFPALTGLEEDWRFTPLKRLRGLTGDLVGGPAPAIGYDVLPAGVTVSTVDKGDPRIGSVLKPFDRISALAYGRATAASLISVDADTVLDTPAVLRVVGGGAGTPVFGHTFLEVGRFAEATIVLEQSGAVTLADNVEVAIGDGARLTLVTVADWAADAVHAQHLRFRLGRDARVTHIQVTLGGDLVRQFTSVDYTGRGGDAELYGLYFADAGQHLEHRQLVDHSVPDCRSYVGYRGALQGEGAHTVWVGDVLIQVQATGTDTYEINRNLVLSDGARADSVPNLEIETGEVAGAGHASTTGRFDDEQLFYLMARGIPEAEARKLVVRGFFAELINKVPVEELRERLGTVIESRLTKAGAWIQVCSVEDVPKGTSISAVLDGTEIAVVHTEDDNFYAVHDVCSHADVPLSEGELDGCTLECWLHGSRFDLRTGEPTGLPATEPVPVFPVKVRNGKDVFVSLTPSNGVSPS